VLLTIASCSDAQTTTNGIQFFNGTFTEARKAAKEQNKHIFLDAYASWCGPCKTMDREVFSNADVGAVFNANFISLHIYMEKGDGPALAKKLPSLDGYPSLLFFDSEGHLNKTILGSRNVDLFLEEAKLVVR
jgi:thioredoxin 1